MKKLLLFLLTAGLFSGMLSVQEDAGSLFRLAAQEEESNHQEAALTLYLQADRAFESAGDTTGVDYAQSLHNTGRVLANLNRWEEGFDYTRKALTLRKRILGDLHAGTIASMNNLALNYAARQEYGKALMLQEEAVALSRKLPVEKADLGKYLTNLGRIHYVLDDGASAAPCWEEALPLVEKNSAIYEYLLDGLGLIYDEAGDKKNARRILGLADEYNRWKLKQPCSDPDCMLDRAENLRSTGASADAKECYLKVLGMEMSLSESIRAYSSYASFLSERRDFAESAQYEKKAAELLKQSGNLERYASSCYLAGLRSYMAKDYSGAVDCHRSAAEVYEGMEGDAAKINLVNSLAGMGNAFFALKDYPSAIQARKRVVDYYAAEEPDSPDYPKALERLATSERYDKRFDDAIVHYERALPLFKRFGMDQEAESCALTLENCYLRIGKSPGETVDVPDSRQSVNREMDRIIREETENLDIYKTYLGNIAYARSLGTIAGCHVMKEDFAEGVRWYDSCLVALKGAIRDEFRLQTEKERMLLWEEEWKTVRDIYDLSVTLPVGQESLMDELAGMLYDAALLSKGILLNSSIEFSNILAGDSGLSTQYRQVKELEAEVERLRAGALTEADRDRILALGRQIESLQLALYRQSAAYADFTDYIGYGWKDVRTALGKSDVAVEFISVGAGLLPSERRMMALVLTAEMDHPRVVPAGFLASHVSGDLVWGQVAALVPGKEQIFFSADGDYNRIAIEYLPLDRVPMSDRFQMHRLSSTKELCRQRPASASGTAVVIGDIDYNGSVATAPVPAGVLRGSGALDTYANLENTRREVDGVAGLFRGKGGPVMTLTGAKASEAAVRHLSGTPVQILHIATHGFADIRTAESEKTAMESCGLVFAGANLRLPDADDDGILTAADIAQLDFRACGLVVLSACETGLGKQGTDGVFGLQRGFKNAGVHSLLVSLAPVSDAVTADFMLAFYRHLTPGQTPSDALQSARRDLKAKDARTAEVLDSFILID